MEKYDYEEAVKSDILEYIKEQNITGYIDDNLRQELEDDMFICDSVTGNASGSYTFSSREAEENLCHNWDLLAECAEHFGIEDTSLSKGAEYWDSSIRCYLLNRVLTDVVEEWNEEHPEEETEDEEGEEA